MKFWEVFFRLLLIVCVPYKKTKLKYKNNDLFFIHCKINPWGKGMTIGRYIFTCVKPNELSNRQHQPFIHHEHCHYMQWSQEGWTYPFKYCFASLQAFLTGKRIYKDNKFEIQAYKMEDEYRKKNFFPQKDYYK